MYCKRMLCENNLLSYSILPISINHSEAQLTRQEQTLLPLKGWRSPNMYTL